MGLERTWIGVRLRGRQEGVGHIEASGIPKSPSPFHFLVLRLSPAGGGQLRLVLHLYLGLPK